MVQPMSSVPTPTVPALVVDNLRKTYGNGVEALKGISLTVQQGDFFALLGPNGAGKSTLIGILSSLVNSTGGDARIFGVSVNRQRNEAMKLIGLVPRRSTSTSSRSRSTSASTRPASTASRASSRRSAPRST
jgi:ABC-2 type transport system ATP-binding protein